MAASTFMRSAIPAGKVTPVPAACSRAATFGIAPLRATTRLARFTVRAEEEKEDKPKAIYADEEPETGFFESKQMSKEQQEKLRQEYYGFGGSPDQAMGSNYFLNIILIITFLAVMCAALGYI